ncbi:hypothetical protein D6D02_05787 [Aureobasidium pullulans]|nr:hypothetical protein D6D26_02589 [Aureobasidium pullulans]THY11386.1 hypothetical protein D6D02_05787 [Aureobasidium pullulans]
MSLTLERRPPASGNKQILRFPSAPSGPPWPPPTWPPSTGLVLSRSKSTERVTASDIESDDDDQQHTNGASVPVQALDRDANGVPLDATVINARGCKRRGGRRTSSAVSTVPSHTHLGSGSMSSAMKRTV